MKIKDFFIRQTKFLDWEEYSNLIATIERLDFYQRCI